jgi:hypothetical protein
MYVLGTKKGSNLTLFCAPTRTETHPHNYLIINTIKSLHIIFFNFILYISIFTRKIRVQIECKPNST